MKMKRWCPELCREKDSNVNPERNGFLGGVGLKGGVGGKNISGFAHSKIATVISGTLYKTQIALRLIQKASYQKFINAITLTFKEK
jgi:hypothetical protein